MSEWQPIETAPDDIPLLVWDGKNVSVAELGIVKWYALAAGDFVYERGEVLPIKLNPTHWMPLPEPPK